MLVSKHDELLLLNGCTVSVLQMVCHPSSIDCVIPEKHLKGVLGNVLQLVFVVPKMHYSRSHAVVYSAVKCEQHEIKVGANEACKNLTEGHRESSNLSGKNKICNIKWSMLLGAVGQTWTALSLLSLHHRAARGVTVCCLFRWSLTPAAGYRRFITDSLIYWGFIGITE